MKQKGFFPARRNDDNDLISTLDIIKDELESLQNTFDYVVEPELVDCYTYEILALETKYCYYLNLCKQRGIAGVPSRDGVEVG